MNLNERGRRRGLFRRRLFHREADRHQVNTTLNSILEANSISRLKHLIKIVVMNKRITLGIIPFVAIIIVVLVIVLNDKKSDICVVLDGKRACHTQDTQPYRYYGTKTPYHIAFGNDDLPNFKLAESCYPEVFYLLSRHTTRYPDREYIEDMERILPNLKARIFNASRMGEGNMCKEDLQKLAQWVITMQPEDDNRLSDSGKREAEEMGRRLRKRFSFLFNGTNAVERFTFQHTTRVRTRETAEAFSKGLFNTHDKLIDFEVNDEVLNFHKSCKSIQKKCANFTYDISEVDKFNNGDWMKLVTQSVSKRIGFNVTDHEVNIAYMACYFGYALHSSDIWCSLFSSDELKVLEFEGDLDDYYKDGYGNDLNYEQACPLAKYMVDLFKSNENALPRAVFHFSHAGGIKKMFSLLGLFRDTLPLTADGLCSQKGRRWRSSLVCPFAANLIFLTYQCEGRRKVAVFHNERPITIQGCHSDTCKMEQFYETYGGMASECNLKKICCS